METNNRLKKLLVVDDSDVQLLIVENVLRGKYETITAKSGKDALAILFKGFVPDLIILDILMPEMDGWETFNRIKAMSLLRDVPVAFLTSVNGEMEKQYASRIGAADMITKPYEGPALIQRIENIIQKNENNP
jgi:putative two-component system response regulator